MSKRLTVCLTLSKKGAQPNDGENRQEFGLSDSFLSRVPLKRLRRATVAQSTNNDDVITPEYSPQDGGGGVSGSKQTCVLTGLTPGVRYELSYEVQQPGGGGYTAVREETANALGEVPFPNVPTEVDCHAIKVTPLATPTPQPPIAGMPPEGE